MSRVYDVHSAEDTLRMNPGRLENWVESTIRSVAESTEDYARANPLSFAAWAFGIGFLLGWKLKPW
jgi:ElaB/YqjD/DUF883 family membrane-anchored ribosome-binding protein